MATKKRIKRIRKPNLNTFQGKLSQLYGKVSAYHKLGMTVEAKHWANELQKFLIEEGLLDERSPETKTTP